MRLGLISSIALAGFLCMSAPSGAVAAQAPRAVVQTVESSSHSAVLAYYYYHGRRYPYRYHGRYYNHRRYSHGYWRYY
jgi:hypothetical protein